MKKFINVHVPVTSCNLRCSYCYVTQNKWWDNPYIKMEKSPEFIRKALSKERLGGSCHLNFCGDGETLIPPEVPKILEELLKEGHTIMVITNGTLTKRFDEIIKIDKILLDNLCFKFSFHFKELIRLNMMDEFFNNIRKVKNAGCSFSLEITPYDELVNDIELIKQTCMKEVGALCHVTIARVDSEKNIPIMTEYSKDEYKNIWSQFNSNMFDFKLSTFNVKRKEFCYAGDWSLLVDLGTGNASQCYKSYVTQNIYKDVEKPIKFEAVGCNCRQPHCFNSHAFLTLGLIPELNSPTYASTRDRETEEGNWLSPNMQKELSSKLVDNNVEYTAGKKFTINSKNKIRKVLYQIKETIR